MPPIYLDYNATTPIAREVADAIVEIGPDDALLEALDVHRTLIPSKI